MPDMSRTGAVSDAEAERQIADVTSVYAGKSETPRTDALLAELPTKCGVEGLAQTFNALLLHAHGLEKETARLRLLLTDAQEEMRLIRMKDSDACYDPTLRARIAIELSPASTADRAGK